MAEPNAPQDPFEMFRRLWGPLGIPVPGMAMPTLDPQEVDEVLAGDAYADAVRADIAAAHDMDVTGVPFFVVDGRLGLSGAQPPDS